MFEQRTSRCRNAGEYAGAGEPQTSLAGSARRRPGVENDLSL